MKSSVSLYRTPVNAVKTPIGILQKIALEMDGYPEEKVMQKVMLRNMKEIV
jgi:hypothetical protein